VVLPAGEVNDDVEVDEVDDDAPVAVTVGAGTPAISNGDGAVQVTKVPGVAGFDASGTGAKVVSGAPDKVVAENGPGLFSGCVTIAPGTVGRLIAVLPAVATCAWPALQPSIRIAITQTNFRMAISAPPGCPAP